MKEKIIYKIIKIIYCFILATSLFTIGSCRKEKLCSSKLVTTDKLNGSWKYAYNYTSEGYRNYTFIFNGSNFKLKKENISDLLEIGTPCEPGYWMDYAAGTLSISNGKITLNGNYTDSMFVTKTSIDSTTECYHQAIGNFSYIANAYFCKDTLVLEQISGTYSEVNRITLLKQ